MRRIRRAVRVQKIQIEQIRAPVTVEDGETLRGRIKKGLRNPQPQHHQHRAIARAAESCDVFISIGTSGVVEPAASLPFIALQNGATVIEINPDETPLSDTATFCLRGAAGVVMERVVENVWGQPN